MFLLIDRFSYDLEKCFGISVRYLFYQPMDEKIKTWALPFPAKENPKMEKALFDWPIVLRYDVKVNYQLISRKFCRHEVFFSRAFAQPTKSPAHLYPFDKPIKSLYFRSFIVLFSLFCSRVCISRSHENHSIANSASLIMRYGSKR